MPMFKVVIEDLIVYGCIIEAEDRDEAQDLFHDRVEKTGDYYTSCKFFSNMREYDGYLNEAWYDIDDDTPPEKITYG